MDQGCVNVLTVRSAQVLQQVLHWTPPGYMVTHPPTPRNPLCLPALNPNHCRAERSCQGAA